MTEQNKNEVSELEIKWREDAMQSFGDWHSQSENILITNRKDIYIDGYLSGCKARKVEAENSYNEAWIDKEVSLDDLNQRLLLMHKWVKQHQYAVNNANKIKNEALEKLKSLEQENSRLKAENDSLLTQIADFVQRNQDDIKSLEQENERLKKNAAITAGRENLAYDLMGDLKDREEMIQEAIPWVKDYDPEHDQIKNWVSRARKLTRREG